MLRNLGIRQDVVTRLEFRMRQVTPASFEDFLNTVSELRKEVCDLQEQHQDEADQALQRERRRDQIEVAVDGLACLASVGATAAFAIFMPPLAVPSFGLAAGLLRKTWTDLRNLRRRSD